MSARLSTAPDRADPRSPLRAVPGRKRRPAHRLPFLVASFVLVGSLVVLIVSAQAMVSQRSFRLQDLSHRTERLQHEYGRLKLRLAHLSAPGRIAEEAKRLGLRVPDPDQVQVIAVPGRSAESSAEPSTDTTAFALKGDLQQDP